MQDFTRYQRQVLLKEWGPAAQSKLAAARILVVGAGGLGCPALQYLTAAGAGTLGIVDPDRVAVTDLHRQILYTEADLGALKVDCAATALRRLNPGVKVQTYPRRFSPDLLSEYDVVLDASDNFETRYLVDDACAALGMPLVYGSVFRFEGQVSVFHWGSQPSSYRDLFPDAAEVPSCEEAGVLGVVPGIIGSLQALEALKIVTGVGRPLAGRLLTYQALHNRFYEITLACR